MDQSVASSKSTLTVLTLFVTLPLLAEVSPTRSADAPLGASIPSPGAHSKTVLCAAELNPTVPLTNNLKLQTVPAVLPAALLALLAPLPAAPRKSALAPEPALELNVN